MELNFHGEEESCFFFGAGDRDKEGGGEGSGISCIMAKIYKR